MFIMKNADNAEKKFLHTDMALLAVFTAAAGVTIIYVLSQILGLEGLGHMRWLLGAIACVATVSLTMSAVEVMKHLRANAHDVYKEDLAELGVAHVRKKVDIRKLCGVVFDVSFILVLCLSILLVTMIITKELRSQAAAAHYTVNTSMLCAVVSAGLCYLYFMTRTSRLQFEKMQKHNSGLCSKASEPSGAGKTK